MNDKNKSIEFWGYSCLFENFLSHCVECVLSMKSIRCCDMEKRVLIIGLLLLSTFSSRVACMELAVYGEEDGMQRSKSDGFGLAGKTQKEWHLEMEAMRKEQKQREASLQAKVQRLEEARRRAENLVGDLGHEVTADLNRAIMCHELGDPEEAGPFLDRMERTLGYIKGSPENARDLFYDVRQPLSQCVPVMEDLLGDRSVAVESKVCPALQALMKERVLQGHRARVDCVLGNLTRNATRFVKEGSIVVSATQVGELTEAEQVGIRFEVKDTGCGIKREDLETIFKDRRQGSNLDEQNGGQNSSGIGLNRASKAVNEMNGKLTVDSVVGQGSIFSFVVFMDTMVRKESHADCTAG